MRQLSVLSLILVCFTSAPLGSGPIGYLVTNLASDVPGLAAFTDATLINAWGIASSGTSPLWLGANGSGTSPIYNGAGIKQGLQVAIPGDGRSPVSPSTPTPAATSTATSSSSLPRTAPFRVGAEHSAQDRCLQRNRRRTRLARQLH